MLNVQIINKSKHPLPAYATELSAGMDIRANLNEPISLAPMQRCLVPTGLYIALPEGFEAQVREDGNLYAIYGTPAESLCGLQVEQFRKMYGIVEGVSDRPYVSNSFHCHVTEDISPIEKQDCEGRFWELCNGGKIQYVRYPVGYNVEAIRALVRRAMSLGYYEGVNLSLAYCDDCGHEELEMDVCPVCGSKNLTKIDRMNGYLSYSRVHGDTRLNAAKMAEIAERKSM